RELAEGKHDCALLSRPVALYWIKKNQWDTLLVGQHPLLSSDYCFAVREGEKAIMADLVEGLLLVEESGEYWQIHKKWMGVIADQSLSLKTFLLYAAYVLVPLLLLFLVILAWTWSLRRQVAVQTEKLRASHDFQSAILTCSPLALISIDLEGKVLSWNPAAEAMFGWKEEEVLGRPLPTIPPDLQENFQSYIERYREGFPTTRLEATRQRKDGTRIECALSTAPIRDNQNLFIGIMGALEDITEKKKIQTALVESEARFRSLFENNHAVMLVIDPRKRVVVDANPAACHYYGWERETLVGMPLSDINTLSPDEIQKEMSQAHERKTYHFEFRHRLANGSIRDVEVFSGPVWIGEEELLYSLIFDITDRKAAEAALAASESRFRNAIKEAPFPIMMHADDGEILALSSTWLEITGYTREELKRLPDWTSRAYGEQSAEVLKKINERYAKDGQKKAEGAFVIRCKDGNLRTWLFSSTSLGHLPDGRRLAISMAADVTESKRNQTRIEHLNQTLRAIRDVNQLIVRERDRFALIQQGCQLLVHHRGYASAMIILTTPEKVPQMWAEAGLDSVFAEVDAILRTGELPPCCKIDPAFCDPHIPTEPNSVCSQCPLSLLYPANLRLNMVLLHEDILYGYLVVSMEPEQAVEPEERSLFAEVAGDLAYALHSLATEEARQTAEQARESLQAQLLQAQKMEAVGRLAGGVAHDFNNMLSVILGYTEMAMMKLETTHEVHADLKEILKAGQRSTEITRQLLAFARKQTISPQVLDLNDTVHSMFKTLMRLIGEQIELLWRPGDASWPIHFAPSQIDQILANLCVNARDAIEGVGKITLETNNATLDAIFCEHAPDSVPGDYVCLTVSDNGCGMDKQTLAKIFDPFFTTKEKHKGTGLGLATVYGIMKQNHGFVHVYSELKQGTTFRLYFPRFEGENTVKTETTPHTLPFGQGETILLVEDEASIRKMGEMMLKNLGYKVITAAAPSEAVQLVQEKTVSPHLLLTDVIMPEMTGRALAEALLAQNPQLKVLYMSGYTANVIAHHGVLDEGVNFIQKPFTFRDLALKVRKALE
ncbi:MAG: PAS domain S-box protein, partial [bacterium]|nr:PAS domain S-box protein [bacterium]